MEAEHYLKKQTVVECPMCGNELDDLSFQYDGFSGTETREEWSCHVCAAERNNRTKQIGTVVDFFISIAGPAKYSGSGRTDICEFIGRDRRIYNG